MSTRIGATKGVTLVVCACALVTTFGGVADARTPKTDAARSCAPNPKPSPTRDLPTSLKPYGADRRFIGEGVLWTVKPRRVVQSPDTGMWELRKQAWFRLEEGRLTVHGRRVGGSGTFRAHIPPMESYPLGLNPHVGPGFIPSSFEFSTPGCWKLTARLGTSTVVLHVGIEDPARST